MKKYLSLLTVMFTGLLLGSCTAIGDIFKTGMGVGIAIVVVIVIIILFVIRSFSKKSE